MKKLIAALFVGVLAVSAFAAPKFPGWGTTDTAALDAAAQEYIAAKSYAHAINCIVLKDLNTGKIKTFADLCTKIDEVAKSLNYTGNTLYNKKQIPACTGKFRKEAWEFCQKNPSSYDIYYVLNSAKVLNMSDEFVCDYLYNYCLTNDRPQLAIVSRAIDIIISKSINLDEAKAKEMLRKLNRKFSPMLIKDKANWEPIIAKIRTAIDAF